MVSKIGYTDLIYDYIIIGSGPAGAIMAKTLTDHPGISVLLLEAGDNNMDELPIRTPSTQTWRWFPNYFWQGRTKHQENADNQLFNWSTGRTLGGGTSVNFEQYVRPTREYMREWMRFSGVIWSPERADSFFTIMENFNGKTNSPYSHGYSGPVNIRQAPVNVPEVTRKLVSAISTTTGYPIILDYNDPATPLGAFYQWQLYQKPDGQRESAASAYLSEDIITPEGTGVNGRGLTVLLRATALRILINDNREAYGVEFLREGYSMTAYANRKVVLTAGINSAQLLMLSGIGPSDVLEAANIPVIFDSPGVGSNLSNHTINTAEFSVNQVDLTEAATDSSSLYTGGAFLPVPDYQASLQRGIQMYARIEEGRLRLTIIDLKPKSRGRIILQNNDPLKIVLADYGALTDEADLTRLMTIFRYQLIPIAEALLQIDPSYQLISPPLEICYNDSLLEDFIRSNISYTYHAQSFNRMAPFDEGGVVDQLGNVYGVSHLAIADTSILPFSVDCNTSSVAYFTGHTVANLLLQEVFPNDLSSP